MKALSHRKQQKGAVLILVTVALFTLLGFTALALDGGYLLLNKTRLQDVVDISALSGAKTLSSPDLEDSTHDKAIDAVYNTVRAILDGDGFGNVLVDRDTLEESVVVEFSDQPVPFVVTSNASAKYIRVRMESVPVTQFFSKMFSDIWQVRVSAVAGPVYPTKSGKICDVIPLLMCASNPEDANFGYKMTEVEGDDKQQGDVVLIKSPAPGSPNMGPGNFQAISLDPNGNSNYRDDLAAGRCIEIDHEYGLDTNAGGNTGTTRQGINTRFGIYNSGPYNQNDGYYSDCTLSNKPFLNYDTSAMAGGAAAILSEGDLNNIQLYSEYVQGDANTEANKGYAGNGQCIPGRRIVKIPVASCSSSGGSHTVTIIGVAGVFLNQHVALPGSGGQGNNQYVIGEFIKKYGVDGTGYQDEEGGGAFRLVLFKDSDSGDS